VADGKKDDGLKPPAAGTLLNLLWPGVAQPVFAAALAGSEGVPPTSPGIDPASFIPPLVRLRETALPAGLGTLPEGLRPADNPLDLDEAESGLSLEASVGTLVHRYLELIAKNGLESWSTARVATLQPAAQRWLRNQGHGEAEAASGAAEVVAALHATLASESGRWVLADHPEAAAEQAWSSADGDAAVNHVIDRIFVADGCRWIIDYKTVRLPETELAQRAESFRPQLARYAGLFADSPLPLRLAIFFPLQGRLVELAA
jgi:hypothetical protein